jgi:hypothetical protein
MKSPLVHELVWIWISLEDNFTVVGQKLRAWHSLGFPCFLSVNSCKQPLEVLCLSRNLTFDRSTHFWRKQLLQSLMKDTKTFLRFLMLLLSDDPECLMKELFQAGLQSHAGKNHNSEDSLPLLEQMLLALQNSPERLLQIQRLIEDLSRNAEGLSILPEDFQTIWEPIQRVAASMQKSSGRRGAKQ